MAACNYYDWHRLKISLNTWGFGGDCQIDAINYCEAIP